MEAIALLNIEMIDVNGSIEIHIGNRAPEAGTLSNNRVAGIVIDDLGYIGWRYQVHRRTECHDQSDRSTQAFHFVRHENCSIGFKRMSHDYNRTFAAFLQSGRLAREFFIVQMTMDGRSEATLNKFLVENIEPCGKNARQSPQQIDVTGVGIAR